MDTVMVDDAMAIREELEAIAADMVNPTEVRVLKGTSPADLIVNCAKEEGCDLIIMGSRGQGGVKGFLGSVSYAVTKESPMTVLIAKEGDCPANGLICCQGCYSFALRKARACARTALDAPTSSLAPS